MWSAMYSLLYVHFKILLFVCTMTKQLYMVAMLFYSSRANHFCFLSCKQMVLFFILFAKHCFTFPRATTFNSKAWLSSNKSMAFLPFDPSNVLQFHMLPQSTRIARFRLEYSNNRINS
ncbi:hypothetical protein ACOSQ3_021538 [Xanthoceras sorbifolium]